MVLGIFQPVGSRRSKDPGQFPMCSGSTLFAVSERPGQDRGRVPGRLKLSHAGSSADHGCVTEAISAHKVRHAVGMPAHPARFVGQGSLLHLCHLRLESTSSPTWRAPR